MEYLKILLMLFVISFSSVVIAQDEEKESIITDRPDQTESAFLVPKGYFQIETGFGFNKSSFDIIEYQMANTLFRYGLFNFLELRLNAGYGLVSFPDDLPFPAKDYSGFEPIFLGVKVPLVKEKGILPQVAFMGHLTLPLASEEFNPDKVLPDFRFNFENTLSDRFSLAYNLGMQWYDFGHSYLYTVALGADMSEKVGVFIEPFGYFYSSQLVSFNADEHYLNGGLTYLIKDNIQLDGFFGSALSHKEIFGGIGFSIRIPD